MFISSQTLFVVHGFLGLFVAISSLLLIIDMLVATFTVHLSKGFFVSKGGYEFALVLIGGLLALLLLGNGKLSLQKLFKK